MANENKNKFIKTHVQGIDKFNKAKGKGKKEEKDKDNKNKKR